MQSSGYSCSENEVLFSKNVETAIKSSNSSLIRKAILTIRVESKIVACRKELLLKISDDYDPFNVYFLNLTDDQFLCLKSNQGLLVDFGSFPKKLIDLLNLCLEQQCNDQPKFFLSLTILGKEADTGARLDIIETNPFKHLIHLSLKFESPDPSSLRKFISNSFQSLKAENKRLEHKIECLQNELTERIQTANEFAISKTRDMERARNEQQIVMSEIESKLRYELDLERQRNKELVKNLNGDQEIIRKLKEANSGHCVNSLLEEKRKLEATIKEQSTILEAKSNELNQLQTDLDKANEIIMKFQAEMASARNKVNILNQVANRQDEVVGNKECRVKKLESDLKLCLEKIKKKDSEQERLINEVESLRVRYEKSMNQIKTNENVITWLNKQLSDLQVQGVKSSKEINIGQKNDKNKSSGVTKLKVHVPELPRINLLSKKANGITVETKSMLHKS